MSTRVIETDVFDYTEDLALVLRAIYSSVQTISKGLESSIGVYDSAGNRLRKIKLIERTLSDGSKVYNLELS